ncbi:AMP-binding protein, partial [Rhizobiaceae sp. 2RAB30]
MASSGPGTDIARAGQLTVYGLFAAQARRDPHAIAIDQGNLKRSYGEIEQRVLRLSAALRERGVVHGDRIALLSENRHEYVEIELAAACLGAIVACQNWRLAPAEIQHCIDLVSPVIVIASQRYQAMLDRLDLHGRPMLLIERDHEALIAGAAPLPTLPDVDPEDGLVILYTSGTTGLPKGALISHRAEIARMTV